MGSRECFKSCLNPAKGCLVQEFVDAELVSIEGQLPAARQNVKDLADEREVAESFYLGSMDDAEAGERQHIGRQYTAFDLEQQAREARGQSDVEQRDSIADQLVQLGNVTLRGCSGPTEKRLCTGPLTEDFDYLEYMTAPQQQS